MSEPTKSESDPARRPFKSVGNGHFYTTGTNRKVSLWTGIDGDCCIVCTNGEVETRLRLSQEASQCLLWLLWEHVSKTKAIEKALSPLELLQCA